MLYESHSTKKYFSEPANLSPRDELAFALSQGFFMMTCRRLSNSSGKAEFISVRDGTLVRVDRSSNLRATEAHYIVYTQLTGFGQEGVGVVKLASEIEVDWVKKLIPRLTDEVDTQQLSGKPPNKKRENPVAVEQLESQTVVKPAESKEDKLEALRQRYLKR